MVNELYWSYEHCRGVEEHFAVREYLFSIGKGLRSEDDKDTLHNLELKPGATEENV